MPISILTLSVVSHGQAELVSALLDDLCRYCSRTSLEVVLTINVPEELPESFTRTTFPLNILRNTSPLGFGENHNRAFQHAKGNFFCVINPDIRIASDIFPVLMESLKEASLGVVAPLVLDSEGVVEDSARRFPTPIKILCKALGRCKERDYVIQDTPLYPDWVGGMLMVFRREIFKEIGGFNQKFFLYYEDVDLCARVWIGGLRVALIPQVSATHLARRSSHNNMRYLLLHMESMLQFFFSFTFLRVMFYRRRS